MVKVIQLIQKIFQKLLQQCRMQWARFRALSAPQRRLVWMLAAAFCAGVACTLLISTWVQYIRTPNVDAPEVVSKPDLSKANDWAELVDNMCRPNSDINLFAMKFDFPFTQCQDVQGRINTACVQQDALRFQPRLRKPFHDNLGRLEVKLSANEEGLYNMHYIVPLQQAAYRQLPLQALAVQIAMNSSNGNEPQGWQTPYLIVQDDFSNIKAAMANQPPAPQLVYYANVPAQSDVLPGPYDNREEAQAVSKKAGGNPRKVTQHLITLETHFNDNLNAVTLSCVSQPIK